MSKKRLVVKIKNIYLALVIALSTALLFSYSQSSKESILLVSLTLVLIIFLLYETNTVLTKNTLVIVAANALSIFSTLLLYKGTGSGLLLLDIVLAIFIFNNITINTKEYIVIHFLFAAASLLFLFQFDLGSIASGWIRGNGISINANSVGIVSLAVFFHLCCIIRYIPKNSVRKVCYFISTLSMGYLVSMSNSRSSLIAMIFFAAISIIRKKEIDTPKYKMLVSGILILSLMFPIFYMALYGKIGNITFLGKNFFSGRQYIWGDALMYIKAHPILGTGTAFGYNTGERTLTDISHNMMLGIQKSFGIIPTLTIIFFMFNDYIIRGSNKKYYRDRITQVALLSSLIVGFGESFLTDCHFCFLFLTFLLMNIENEDKYV